MMGRFETARYVILPAAAMEKIFQILAVLGVLMLVIALFFRGREARYRPYGYLRRIKPTLPEGVRDRLVAASTGAGMEAQQGSLEGEADAVLFDAETRLLFVYRASGSLVIYRQTGPDGYKEMQWLAAPLDSTGLFFDPEEKTLYIEAGGSLFVYGC
jgi:hypothetical protein